MGPLVGWAFIRIATLFFAAPPIKMAGVIGSYRDHKADAPVVHPAIRARLWQWRVFIQADLLRIRLTLLSLRPRLKLFPLRYFLLNLQFVLGKTFGNLARHWRVSP
jgi:hypothetical protein